MNNRNEPANLRARLAALCAMVQQLAEEARAVDPERGDIFQVETVADCEAVLAVVEGHLREPEALIQRTVTERREEAADGAAAIAGDLATLLYEKQLAYGDSGRIANGLWRARLAQYLTPDGAHYLVPVELFDHVPRITRLDDRINRIISNPAGDRLGESPWRDAAGDCVIGALNAETEAARRSPAPEPEPAPVDHSKDPPAAQLRYWNEGAFSGKLTVNANALTTVSARPPGAGIVGSNDPIDEGSL